MRKLIVLLSLIIPFSPFFSPPSVRAQGLASWAEQVRELHLRNGMTFLLYRRGEAPIFSAYIRFRAGGLNEEEGKTGLAHFMEHMAFKGTEKIDGTRFSRMIEEAGGQDFNATTSKDMTTYFVSLPSDKLQFWAELESERIFKPVFREFDEEKKVVLEERRMRVDNDPEGRFYEQFLSTAFQKSPYRWPTIGDEKDIQHLSLADLEAFWKGHYSPRNAVGVLVGNFDLKEATRILEQTFGKITVGEGVSAHSAPFPEPPQVSERRSILKLSARPRLWIGFHKPTLPDPDDYLFDLLDQILGEGRSSRLYKRLVLEDRVASHLETSTSIPGSLLPNLFVIEIDLLAKNSPEEVLKRVDDELEKIKKRGVLEKEMVKARNRLAVDILWSLKTNSGLASQLSYFQVIAGDWRYLANYLTEIGKFGPEDLQRIAEKYLKPSNRTVAILSP